MTKKMLRFNAVGLLATVSTAEFRIIEAVFSLGLFINAALFIPQILRLIKEKDSRELSLITFGGFWLIQLVTVLHGFINRDYLLAIGYILSLLTCGTVVILIFLYRFKS